MLGLIPITLRSIRRSHSHCIIIGLQSSTSSFTLCPLQLLLPDCIDPLQLLLPVCVCFSCCSPIASASAAAHRLHLLQLLLLDCIRFNCCSSIASALTACCSPFASACDSSPCPTFSNIPSRSLRFSKLKYKACVSLVYSRPTNIPLLSHTDTHAEKSCYFKYRLNAMVMRPEY